MRSLQQLNVKGKLCNVPKLIFLLQLTQKLEPDSCTQFELPPKLRAR